VRLDSPRVIVKHPVTPGGRYFGACGRRSAKHSSFEIRYACGGPVDCGVVPSLLRSEFHDRSMWLGQYR
jgi:hypothetical protein